VRLAFIAREKACYPVAPDVPGAQGLSARWRSCSAILRASSAMPRSGRSLSDQPATRRENRSRITARYTHQGAHIANVGDPAAVGCGHGKPPRRSAEHEIDTDEGNAAHTGLRAL
jgi:hypothetical protein